MAGRLEGKIALITGTAANQGRAAAMLFANEGAKVAGCDLDAQGAAETVEMVKLCDKGRDQGVYKAACPRRGPVRNQGKYYMPRPNSGHEGR